MRTRRQSVTSLAFLIRLTIKKKYRRPSVDLLSSKQRLTLPAQKNSTIYSGILCIYNYLLFTLVSLIFFSYTVIVSSPSSSTSTSTSSSSSSSIIIVTVEVVTHTEEKVEESVLRCLPAFVPLFLNARILRM